MMPLIIAFLPFVESINRQQGFILLLILGCGLGIKLLKRNIKLDFLEEVFGLFLLAAVSGIPFSWSISNSINELLLYASFFIVFVYVRRSKFIPKLFEKIVIISSIILSLISFFYLLPIQILPYPPGGLHLFQSTFGHNHLAGLLLFAVPISMYQYIDTKSRKWGLLTGFFLVSLIFTYSRVAYLIVLFYLFYFFRKNAGKFLAISIVGITIFYILVRIYSNLGVKLDFLPKQIFKPITFENVRLGYWRQAFEGFKLSPFFGTGLSTFLYVSNRFAPSQNTISFYAHNHFIQLFSETGIIGGSLFAILIIFALAKIIKSYPLSLGVIGSVVNNLLDYDWQILSLFLYFWIAVAILIPLNIEEKKKHLSSQVVTGLISIGLIIATSLIVLGFNNWDAGYYQTKARKALENKRFDEVRGYNNRAMQLDSYNIDYYIFRGTLEDGLGDYLTAREYFVKATLLSPYGAKEIYREILQTYIEEAEDYYGRENIKGAKSVLLTAKSLYPYLILIDIERDFHSKKAIGDAIAYVKNKAGYYKFQSDDIRTTNKLIDK